MSKPSKTLKLVIKAGRIKAIYDDALTALFSQADVETRRASHVEPEHGGWYADLSPVSGPTLRGFTTRRTALDAEVKFLRKHVIV